MAGEGRPLTKMEALRDLVNGNRLDLNGLNTSSKASIVEAVNEIVSGIGAVISDSITSTWTTWSSSKIFTELGKKASSVNPTFTGTIGIPDGGLSIAKTSGLQTTLDSKIKVDPSNEVVDSTSVVYGGTNNDAIAPYTSVAGKGGVAATGGMRVYGSQFSLPGDGQDISLIMKRQTTSASASLLQCEGNTSLAIPESCTWAIEGLISGRRIDVDGENIGFTFRALVKRDSGSTTALVGVPAITEIGKNTGNPWTISISVTTPGSFYIFVNGENGKTIRWLATLKIANVSG